MYVTIIAEHPVVNALECCQNSRLTSVQQLTATPKVQNLHKNFLL